jgi:RimJ/RimL family protein N-acetyltransferase
LFLQRRATDVLDLLHRSNDNDEMKTMLPTTTFSPSGQIVAVTPIRELDASERSLFLEHLLALGDDDRYLRFGSALSNAAIERYVAGIDLTTDTIFGIFDDRLKLAAAGHFAPLPPNSQLADPKLGRTAEFGLSVRGDARRRGLGTALFLRAAAHARNLAISSLFMHCLSENRAMIRIARKAGMDIRQLHGEADAYLALKPGTVATAIEEGVQRQIALFDFAVKRQMLLAQTLLAPVITKA